MTYFYKFASEAEFLTAISNYSIDGEVPTYIGNAAVDVVGVIWKPTGEALDTYTPTSVVFTPLDGWHVNTTAPITGWEEYAIIPTSPTRVFAGA